MDQEINAKIQEIQILEQNLHNILLQKQSFQIELAETQNALDELKNSGEEVYKLIGQIMIKAEKTKMEEELKNNSDIFSLRLKTIEKQEQNLSKKIENIRDELIKHTQS